MEARAPAADPTWLEHPKLRRALPAIIGAALIVAAGGYALIRHGFAEEAPVIAPPAKREEPPNPLASMEVESRPAGEVRVNGKLVGVSPVRIWEQPGQVKVEVSNGELGFSKEEVFTLERGDNGARRIVVGKGTLEVRVRPNAVVFLDGKLVGQTPLAPLPVYEGRHTVKLIAGSLKKEVSLDYLVKPGEANVLDYKFIN
jgi:serine/threonine-protein kinase